MSSISELNVGFSRAVITPVPCRAYLDGYGFRITPSEGVFSDLYVNVCALSVGEQRFILASFDLCGMNRRIYQLLAGGIEAATGVGIHHMALLATHTHSGPACGVLDVIPIDLEYFSWVGDIAGQCAKQALENAVPGQFICDIPGEIGFSINRRGRDVIDRRVRTACFVDHQGQKRGTLFQVSCHAVLNKSYQISADYLTYLNQAASDDQPVVCLAGRGADVNPDLTRGDAFTLMEQYGKEAAAFLAKEPKVSAPSDPLSPSCNLLSSEAFSVCYETVDLPVKEYPSTAELQQRILTERQKCSSFARDEVGRRISMAELNWLYTALDQQTTGIRPCLRVPLQLLKLGNMIFFFVPFEMLTLTGNKLEAMAVEAGYAPECIYTVGYANSVGGYLAPLEEFAFGGYELAESSHWYNLPECSEETEAALLSWFKEHL